MQSTNEHAYTTPFSDSHSCTAYLFLKKWPNGFFCPFCQRHQLETPAAETVVCRYCRKQTSISAGTVMHGSRKSLTAWLQAASLFSFCQNGVSSRALQQHLHLTSYQTAWSMLHKLRDAAGIAEKNPLSGTVYMSSSTVASPSPDEESIRILSAFELATQTLQPKRIKMTVLEPQQEKVEKSLLVQIISPGTTLLQPAGPYSSMTPYTNLYNSAVLPSGLGEKTAPIADQAAFWLNRVYRGTVGRKYLKRYLNEFCFRFNTKTWPDRLAVLDHLVSGLVSPRCTDRKVRKVNVPGDHHEK
jgi:hypothetical protein